MATTRRMKSSATTGSGGSWPTPWLMALVSIVSLIARQEVVAFVNSRSPLLTKLRIIGRDALSALDSPADEVSTAAIAASKSTSGNDHWIEDNIERRPMGAPQDTVVVGPTEVLVYDTTLRDGTQGESVSASCDDKLKIAQRLSDFGVDYIEGGWPGSNPKDAEFFLRAQTELSDEVRSKLVAFGSTRRKRSTAEDDSQIQLLLESAAPTVCLVAKSSAWQVTEILRATPEENIDMIRDSVQYLTSHGGRRVMVDMEHFFDGYKADPDYVLECARAAVDAGASVLVLCDTNGGTMPWQVSEATEEMRRHFPTVTIGVHAHNDCGMAVANSLSAAQYGAGLIQGTINGIGERTGNADLCSIVPTLSLHMDSQLGCNAQLDQLTSVSKYVDELLGRIPNPAAPFVGNSAFCHKGGLHVAAMERNPLSYQHVDPTLVGNERRTVVSELAGRQTILGKMRDAGVDVDGERALAILERVKKLEAQGYTFEGAEASVHLMILHATRGYCPPFQVLDYSVQVYDSDVDSASRVIGRDILRQHTEGSGECSADASALGPTARATVKVRTLNLDEDAYESMDDSLLFKDQLEVSDGNGPVDALAKALQHALVPSHPTLASMQLVDYKVRILDPEEATGAATRVMIEFRDGEETWTTTSVDRNIISASVNALVDGFEYALIEHAQSCMLCDDAF